jgi:hypothetical protein
MVMKVAVVEISTTAKAMSPRFTPPAKSTVEIDN